MNWFLLSQNQAPIIVHMHTSSSALLQLLRLSSPALPVGAYAYSQGLESACDQSIIKNKEDLIQWLTTVLQQSFLYQELPLFLRLYRAHQAADVGQQHYWNAYLLASRETRELRLEDSQLGIALVRLLKNQGLTQITAWQDQECSFSAIFSLACVEWQIDEQAALHGLLWAWLENQVSVAIKLIPLGQTAGQYVLQQLIPLISAVVTASLDVKDDNIGASCPGLVFASMQHEEQYSRLFRS